jgi:acetyl-CoA carboxylase carboxyl transferase subunit beta
MSWFRKEKRQRTTQRQRLEIPADAWDKCPECGHTDLREKFDRNLQVCPQCGHHRRLPARRYLDVLTDPGSWVELFGTLTSIDVLGFEGYEDRIAVALRKAGRHDAILTGHATLDRVPVNLGIMDFAFMGGSMGAVVGEKIARLATRSLEHGIPLILVSASGGARMQEGAVSLMQLAKTSVMIAQLKDRGIPFVSVLTNPTTGGVSASYGMQGDVNIAEPGAVIGFAGPRVIKQTIGQDLPQGFQTAEFLLEHGMVDLVVPRHELGATTGRLLRMMQRQAPAESSA